MSKQTQGSLAAVGGISAGIWLVAFVALMVVGGFAFSPALFLALAVAAVAAVVLFRGFHRGPGHRAHGETPAPVAERTSDHLRSPGDAPSAEEARAGHPDASGPQGGVKTGTVLPGEEELADRKGEWRYESHGGAAASGPSRDAVDAAGEGTKPPTLNAPREGGADDLKEIKGVGPKLEEMLHGMGLYHFDQIAAWGPAEVAWVDQNLEGFKGRVSRDDWVAQAKVLAGGGETEFSKRVDKGDVY
ncbi:Predicted 5' DNA nuclease, flap endonuclease-1-like, helix-3-turn-helix (H3TH) domain [Tranquillimonas rosea]|uniref:Predicted 5' DNA nuclease, flap endonuclease-1-like, helix-3-turn-helix (H3TH) domain n=1 Tax=Tranquillimonas rosea TaxID=641238 RepID=A0A1H9Q2W0_9RHOB|nr:endonuclease [Tranquillimonas rosea]SER54926.1 Predicted 5' DNA nuclease, flap endonuclease-1-like, helix-3-turn-helix (H3TH) domain [Tranquillimonas rosea]